MQNFALENLKSRFNIFFFSNETIFFRLPQNFSVCLLHKLITHTRAHFFVVDFLVLSTCFDRILWSIYIVHLRWILLSTEYIIRISSQIRISRLMEMIVRQRCCVNSQRKPAPRIEIHTNATVRVAFLSIVFLFFLSFVRVIGGVVVVVVAYFIATIFLVYTKQYASVIITTEYMHENNIDSMGLYPFTVALTALPCRCC